MKYTVRFAHMKELLYKVGDVINRSDIIGIMSNSGSEKTGIHLHIDVVEDVQKIRYSLNMITKGDPPANKHQLDLFIDNELFGVEPVITTPYNDPEYYKTFGKQHPAYDVVPFDRHETTDHYAIHWNRSVPGTVVHLDENDPGYGNVLYISFEI